MAGDEPTAPVRTRHRDRSSESEADTGYGPSVPAGRPSNWEDQRRSSYAGRRSRRNSVSEDSQVGQTKLNVLLNCISHHLQSFSGFD